MITKSLQHEICSLFEVHADEGGVQRIVTPLEYTGSSDAIVVRVRPSKDGVGFLIDENGEAAFYAGMNGGDVESDAVGRWANDLRSFSPVQFTEDEKISVFTKDDNLIAPYIFRVAEAAQQLHAIATARIDRHASDFKDRINEIMQQLARDNNIKYESDVELPIAGGLKADYVVGTDNPLILVVATSSTRLLEAEVIYMQYRDEKKKGYVLAVAEDQSAVGKKQFERAAYYTNKTVIYNPNAFGSLMTNALNALH
jgi:hypothetical protein